MTSNYAKAKATQEALIAVSGNCLSPLTTNLLRAVAELNTDALAELYTAIAANVELARLAEIDTAALVSSTDWATEKALLAEGKMIAAIKRVRERIPTYGLYEAKMLVESWRSA